MRLLFVCTGNLCRSPVAERLAVAWVRQHAGPEAGAVQVASAGLAGRDGEAMHGLSAAALRRLGGDDAGFRSRSFVPDMAVEADLVLTMTRAQRRTVLEQTPRGLRRTFTLREAASLLGSWGAGSTAALPLQDRAPALALHLDAARRNRASTSADDIADPIGRRASAHREAAGAIAEALRPLMAVLVPVRDHGATSAAAPAVITFG